MYRRQLTVLLCGLIFGAARLLGLHFHVDEVTADRAADSTRPAAFETPHHHTGHDAAASPAGDDDVDVDEPATSVSTLPLPAVLMLLLGIAATWLAPVLPRATRVVAPPFRPPRVPPRRSLTPPSHAPPCAA